jgi:hypothetical protein
MNNWRRQIGLAVVYWLPINAGIRRSTGIIAGSLMLLMVGAGLFLLVPPIGAVLMFLGFTAQFEVYWLTESR